MFLTMRLALAAVLALLAMATPARAEMFADLYTGKSFTLDGDIRVKQPALGNDFTLEGVSFPASHSFSGAAYYGLRLGYFFEKYPWLGTAIEYFHFKMFADTSGNKRLVGTHDGSAGNTSAPVRSVIQQFQITHGVSYLMLDALLRYALLQDAERFPKGRLQLYGGAGVGPVITHAEDVIDNVPNDARYEVAGVGVQGFVGVRALVFKYVGAFVEYKFTHSSLNVSAGFGRAYVDENTHHVVGGLTFSLPSF